MGLEVRYVRVRSALGLEAHVLTTGVEIVQSQMEGLEWRVCRSFPIQLVSYVRFLTSHPGHVMRWYSDLGLRSPSLISTVRLSEYASWSQA